jgi:hypothetical protein
MKISLNTRLCAVAFGLAVLWSSPASAQTQEFPAGQACSFALRAVSVGGHRVLKTFTDTNGNIVRILSTGTGGQVTLTNLATGATLSLPSNGAVQRTSQDGNLFTTVMTGHNILFLFPTDVPAGPTTTLYAGRVVFTSDSAGVFTLLGTSGKSTDICATLSN